MTPEQKLQRLNGMRMVLTSGNECLVRVRAARFDQQGIEGRAAINVKMLRVPSTQDAEEVELALDAVINSLGMAVSGSLPPIPGERGARTGMQFVANGIVSDPHDN